MYLTCLQSIIITLATCVLGAKQVEQEDHKYFASAFEDLVQLAKQEILLIQHLKIVQESISKQLKTLRVPCQEDDKFSMSSILDISRTLPSESDILGGAIGLVYIQLNYDMKVQDMMKGSLKGCGDFGKVDLF